MCESECVRLTTLVAEQEAARAAQQQHRDRLQSELQLSLAEQDALGASARQLQQQLATAQRELTDTEAAASQQQSELQSEIAELRSRLSEYGDRIAELELARLEQADARADAQREQIDALTAEKDDLSASVAALQSAIAAKDALLPLLPQRRSSSKPQGTNWKRVRRPCRRCLLSDRPNG